MGKKDERRAVIGVSVAALSVMGCGSATINEPVTANEAAPLVVQQVNTMRDLRTWGAEHVHLVWSEGKVSIRNDGDAMLSCGASSTETSFHPDHYFEVRPQEVRELDVPNSPMVRCIVQWKDAARIARRDEHELASMFEEPTLAGTPVELHHSASLVFMPNPMPNLGAQIESRYTLLE